MIPGPDSAAQIPIQAAEYVRRLGALVPCDICPPLLPLLIAALGFLGIPEPAGYVVVVLAAYAGGCATMYALVRKYRAARTAAFAALLYALAPSRLPPPSLESGTLLLSWSLVPVLLIALDRSRRALRPGNLVAALGAAALIWTAHPAGIGGDDLLAAVELAAVVGVCMSPVALPRRVALLGFLAAGAWMFLFGGPARDPLPYELWANRGSGGSPRRVFGVRSLETEMNPIQAQARAVIRAPGRLEESLLWLRAMAAEALLSDDHQKFSGALEVLAEQGGWRMYGLPDPNPAVVVLVSRHCWQNLAPIRGRYDIEALSQYVAWAGRPEPAGFRSVGNSAFEIQADLGPLDMFLVRSNCEPGWRAYLEGPNPRELAIECDPLGFMVVDAGREGETRVRLEFQPSWIQRIFPEGMPHRDLPAGEFPRIIPGGVIEAVGFTPPPFRPGASLSIFGHHFLPDTTDVFFGEMPGEVLWVSPQQINVRLPQNTAAGELNVVVETAGRRSFGEEIEIAQ
jgi:hypothetical protein